jgi:hypothetical protein
MGEDACTGLVSFFTLVRLSSRFRYDFLFLAEGCFSLKLFSCLIECRYTSVIVLESVPIHLSITHRQSLFPIAKKTSGSQQTAAKTRYDSSRRRFFSPGKHWPANLRFWQISPRANRMARPNLESTSADSFLIDRLRETRLLFSAPRSERHV